MPLCMRQGCHSPMPIFQDGNRQSSNFPSDLQRNQKERTLQGRDLLLLCKELSTSEFSIGSEVWGKVLGMAFRDCSTTGFGSLGSGYGHRDQVYGLGMRVLQTAPRMLRDNLCNDNIILISCTVKAGCQGVVTMTRLTTLQALAGHNHNHHHRRRRRLRPRRHRHQHHVASSLLHHHPHPIRQHGHHHWQLFSNCYA